MALALQKNSQNDFRNAVKNIKNLLKEGKLSVKGKETSSKHAAGSGKRKRDRGLIYVGHVPHGFYEEQMREYFKQFGVVTKARVMRSRNTGRSKGYAFVQFLHPEVAQVVADTMNNYLMNNRLLKVHCIPPEKQRENLFSGKAWSRQNFPKLHQVKKNRNIKNRNKDETEYKEFVERHMTKLETLKSKLAEYGLEYDFKFADVPEFEDKPELKDSKKSEDQKKEKNSKQIEEIPNLSLEALVEKQDSDDETSDEDSYYDGPVLEYDESDDEIGFNVPDFVKIRPLKKPENSKRPMLSKHTKKIRR